MNEEMLKDLIAGFFRAMPKVAQVGGENLGYFSYATNISAPLKKTVIAILKEKLGYTDLGAEAAFSQYFKNDNDAPYEVEFLFNPVYAELLSSTKESEEAAEDGGFTVQAYGGTAPYSYQLTDALDVPIGTAQENGIFTGLAAATYKVAITDSRMDGETPDPRSGSITVVVSLEGAV